MKKVIVIICIVALMGGAVLLGAKQEDGGDKSEYLRIHIRADSNEEEAQTVKYIVRDEVVKYLTPVVANCYTKEEAMRAVRGEISNIEDVASEVLRENGFSYGAKACVKREDFPTRVYENVTLEAGCYDALILSLGSGKGDNWWCVVYPPLCFQGGEGSVVYKSRIKEIIEKFFSEK